MKAVIFDLDGTLLDTIGDLAEAVNYALEKTGYKRISVNTIKTYVGNGAGLLIARSIPQGFENEKYELCKKAFSEYYMSRIDVFTKPYEGIMELLGRLNDAGIKTAVLSNKPDGAVKKLAHKYFKGMENAAFGEREGIKRKPDPSGVYDIMERLGAAADETVYVGDSEVDIETAANAGIRCICCAWGFKGQKFLEEKGAKYIAKKPEDILAIIRQEEFWL